MSSQPEITEDPAPDDTPGVNWGRILDAAGIGAGLLLIVIVADIWSDGRLISRRLHRQPHPGESDERTGN